MQATKNLLLVFEKKQFCFYLNVTFCLWIQTSLSNGCQNSCWDKLRWLVHGAVFGEVHSVNNGRFGEVY